jgi:hypothetical protein
LDKVQARFEQWDTSPQAMTGLGKVQVRFLTHSEQYAHVDFPTTLTAFTSALTQYRNGKITARFKAMR